ncbi:hypothetical protein PoB_000780300 [Plakobranchus ocellatus]|uniref:Uncharacterized protein n=1 Tax=Plakobranchus ocellatus TaxID=259542 RepID=A0AAV3YFW0_9GAST|nr:hypothetical protein PoB_000780300 [Plakobranchus ocellatus]
MHHLDEANCIGGVTDSIYNGVVKQGSGMGPYGQPYRWEQVRCWPLSHRSRRQKQQQEQQAAESNPNISSAHMLFLSVAEEMGVKEFEQLHK